MVVVNARCAVRQSWYISDVAQCDVCGAMFVIRGLVVVPYFPLRILSNALWKTGDQAREL